MKTKVTGYLTQKHGFYYVVLNLPTDEKGKRNRKTLSTGLSTDRHRRYRGKLEYTTSQYAVLQLS